MHWAGFREPYTKCHRNSAILICLVFSMHHTEFRGQIPQSFPGMSLKKILECFRLELRVYRTEFHGQILQIFHRISRKFRGIFRLELSMYS